MSLEEKLDEAIRSSIWVNQIDPIVKDKVHPDWFNANGQYFTFGIDHEAIKQAFIDEGWKDWSDFKKYEDIARQSGLTVQGDEIEMTGQEWYERFEKELKPYWKDIPPIVLMTARKVSEVKE